jgi:SAM-dependent methyltransferase
VDPTPAAVEWAQRFQAPNVTFQCGTLREAMESSREKADLALLLDVIEHVPDDAALVREAVASLRPGGYLLVTVPAGMELWSPHDEVFGHYRRYDRSGLASVLSGLDTETLLLSHFNARLYPVIRAIRGVRRARSGGSGAESDSLAGSDLRTYPRAVNAALEAVFAGEGRRLAKVLAGEAPPYRRGASLMAIVRRRPG